MIKNMSRHAADRLSKEENKWESEVLAYGLEIIIGCTLNLILIITAAVCLDTLWTTVLCLISYISFRRMGGGVHLETWPRCLCTGVILIVGLGWAADTEIPLVITEGVFFLTFIIGGWAICKWVPATCKKEIRDENIRKYQKIKTTQVLGFWFLINVLMLYFGFPKFTLAVSFGILASSFLITPWGYWVMQALDNILNIINRRLSDV